MDLHDLDRDLDLPLDPDQDRRDDDATDLDELRALASPRPPRPIASLTNSPGCRPCASPAVSPDAGRRPARAVMRRVRVDAWSEPASVRWDRPSRTLRKVARRAVEADAGESA